MKQLDLSDSLTAARNLLGWRLIHDSPEGKTSGYIVEAEAYDMNDPASHSFGGLKGRNVPMYKDAGTVYVYFTYGMHYCVNIVTGPKDHGQAVLIRALEPLEGIGLMKKRRGIQNEHMLTNGPAKLTQALGIGPKYNDTKLKRTPNMSRTYLDMDDGLYLEHGVEVGEVVQTTRVGISKAIDQPWRFYIAGNPFVSKP